MSSCRVLVLEAATNREVLLAAGADAHLARPVHARDLVAAVDAALGGPRGAEPPVRLTLLGSKFFQYWLGVGPSWPWYLDFSAPVP